MRFTQLFWQLPVSSPEKPGQQTEDNTNQNAGRYREISAKVAILVGEIPGQFAQPAESASGPDPRSDDGDQHPENHQIFSELLHDPTLA